MAHTGPRPVIEVALSLDGRSLKLNTASDVEDIVLYMQNNLMLTKIKLSTTSIGPDAARAIATSLNQQNHLQVADLSDIFTGRTTAEIPPAVSAFGQTLCAIQSLRVVNFSDNAFGPIGAQAMSHLLSTNTNIQAVYLNNNGLGKEGGRIIADALLNAKQNAESRGNRYTLKVFHAGRNRLENVGATCLAEAFKACGTLEEIHLPQNGISHDGIISISSSLHTNPNLRQLDLNDNTVGEAGGEALARALTSCPKLHRLDLGDCLLRPVGAKAVCEALTNSHDGLEFVNLMFNEIDDGCMAAIISMLQAKMALNQLELDGNTFSTQAVRDLEDALRMMGKGAILGSLDENENETEEEEEEEEERGEEEIETISDVELEEGVAQIRVDDGPIRKVDGVEEVGLTSQSETELHEGTISDDSLAIRTPKPTTVTKATAIAVAAIPPTLGGSILSFAGRGLRVNTAGEVDGLVDEIKEAGQVAEIKLSTNSLGVEAAEALAAALKEKSFLEVADFSDIFTGRLMTEIPQCVTSFGNALMHMKYLRVLDFSDNAFGPICISAISPLLSTNYNIRVLRFVNNGMGKEGARLLSEALIGALEAAQRDGVKYNLEAIHAGRNRLENEGAISLARAIRKIGTLKEIHLPQNGINHPGVAALADSLVTNRDIESLDLNDNTLTLIGANALAAVLPQCPLVRSLDLGDCLLGPEGTAVVAKALAAAHPKLEMLNLSYNDIDDTGAIAVADMVQNKHNLVQLDLDGNMIHSRGLAAIESALDHLGRPEALAPMDENEGSETEGSDLD
eukprot:comp11814_c0_seq1/m.6432 comp11814_c0_seq1/g.6432  ORF comp11814_c0_seq1/g.6432 comp11814_c0_seq1/m.6432 type:complete len:794 (-) comp11814_c0_seq1:236-2617(-)